jgi:hypothetical protein
MATWLEFQQQQPELAEAGQKLLYQFGVGLAFLSTVRRDGGPRVHPMCPVLLSGRLLALIVPSPKRHDLTRDGRYAMHSFPAEDNEDALYLTGNARELEEPELVSALVDKYVEERSQFGLTADAVSNEMPFEFCVETVMLTVTTGHGDPDPVHTIWHA